MKFTIPFIVDADKLKLKYTHCTCEYNEQIITLSIDDTDISKDIKVIENGKYDVLIKLNKHYISTGSLEKFKKNFDNESWAFIPFVTSIAASQYIGDDVLEKYAK